MDSLLSLQRDIPAVEPGVVFALGQFPVTNSFLMVIAIALFFLGGAFFVVRRFALSPGRVQSAVEILYESMRETIAQIAGDEGLAGKLFPLVATLFIYIGVANLAGLIPGLTAFEVNGIPLLRTPTTDFNVTFSLALAMVVLIQIASVKKFGALGHLGKYIQVRRVFEGFQKGVGEGLTAIIGFFVGLLDIISEFAKVISLSLRLFGNMYAGTVLATIILGAVTVILPSLWLGLSLLFAVVQAMVFGALVTAYYALAVTDTEAP